jgi:protein O-GlcNAc transferase
MAAERGREAFDLHRRGRLDEAVAAYRDALAATPADAALCRGLGLCLLQQGDIAGAESALREALKLHDDDADAASLLATVLLQAGRADQARPLVERLQALRPRDAYAAILLAECEERAGQLPAAEAALRRALALDPQQARAWFLLGVVLHRGLRWAEALAAYERAQQLGITLPDLAINRGQCLELLGRIDQAIGAYREALAVQPGRAQAWARLAGALAQACRFEEEAAAVQALQGCLAAPAVDAADLVEPFLLLYLPLHAGARNAALDRYVKAVESEAAALPRPPPGAASASREAGPLRIGYLSPDFGEHAVGSLVRDLFAAHDRTRVTVSAYSLRRHQGATAAAIRRGCDRFLDVEDWPSARIAAAIAADGIDILVDLGGFTLGARPQVLALRPAPLQLGWLGFIHDYRAPFLDYLLLDDALAPAGCDHDFGSALLRLPGTMLPGCPLPAPDPGALRSHFGLPEDVFLFASFNNSYKLDAALLDAWADIARRAPLAHFAVFAPECAAPALAASWAARALDPARLHLLGRLPMDAQMSRMACCDLFLDAFRYQAGATGIAAAAVGLPLLSRFGDSPAGRLGVSLNRHLGMDALVCADTRAYVTRAVALATDRGGLVALRRQLRQALEASRLLDPRRLARALEQQFAALVAARRARRAQP